MNRFAGAAAPALVCLPTDYGHGSFSSALPDPGLFEAYLLISCACDASRKTFGLPPLEEARRARFSTVPRHAWARGQALR
jgi:hypothetical protein